MTTWSPAFQVGSSTVGVNLNGLQFFHVSHIEAVGDTVVDDETVPGSMTVTTVDPHNFAVGWKVSLRLTTSAGTLDTLYTGTYTITAVTEDTFSFYWATDVAGFDLGPGTTDGYPQYGVAISPPDTYLQYRAADAQVDAIAAKAPLFVEQWDYNTIRVVWGSSAELNNRALKDQANGLEPLVVITRSGTGYPVTPLDGEVVLWEKYFDVVTTNNSNATVTYRETQNANPKNAWNRPALSTQSLYDRNLTPGRWYYYTIFFYLGRYDTTVSSALIDQAWVVGESMDAMTPVDHGHGEKLYSLIPQYYQSLDQQFVAATGRDGVLQRLTQVLGFEIDYTKTLAESLEHIYDIDSVHDDLMHSLGVFNFGVPVEDGLGDNRYRAILATISNLYEQRGSIRGLTNVVTAGTKYRCKVVEGTNLLNLPDDAEFTFGSGSWSSLYPSYTDFLLAHEWLPEDGGLDVLQDVAMSSVTKYGAQPGQPDRLNARGKAMYLRVGTGTGFDAEAIAFDDPGEFDGTGGGVGTNGSFVIACGLGSGFVSGRHHEAVATPFYPRTHGVKCAPGEIYTFSFYTAPEKDQLTPGAVAAGIMWFNVPQNGVFNIDRDFISKTEGAAVTDANDGIGPPGFGDYWTENKGMYHCSVSSAAPDSYRGQPFVYAVPYIVTRGTYARYITACSFSASLNTAQDVVV